MDNTDLAVNVKAGSSGQGPKLKAAGSHHQALQNVRLK